VTGLDRPVQIVSANDHSGRLYVAQQRGTVLVLPSRSTFLDISNLVDCCENGGLLSLVFHPSYASNGQLFVLYVNKDGNTVLARYRRGDPEIGRASCRERV